MISDNYLLAVDIKPIGSKDGIIIDPIEYSGIEISLDNYQFINNIDFFNTFEHNDDIGSHMIISKLYKTFINRSYLNEILFKQKVEIFIN